MRPLRGLVANAGLLAVDTRNASADGYELTFAVNYLAHAQLSSGRSTQATHGLPCSLRGWCPPT